MEDEKTVECPPDNFTANQNESSLFCPYYTDPVICWPMTASGSLAAVRCPEKFKGIILFPGNATRYCYGNGTWQEKANYSQCLHNISTEFNVHNYIYIIIYYVGFSVSVVALSIALFLFLFFRCLRCLRNTIHCNLIAVVILKHLLYLKMVVTMPIVIHETDSPVHEWICKLIFTFFNYLLMSSFFWMLIEGLYLHTILVWSFSHEGLKFWHCVIIGWCVPAGFTVIWAIVRWRLEHDSCLNAINDNTGSKYEYFDYIYIVPIYIVLLVNAIFLASTVWILWTKLRASSSSQHMLYRKTTKASLILFPLLGITYLVFYSAAKNIFMSYVNVFLQSFQGLFVAIFYCFLNFEVQNMVKKWLSRWHDGRNVSLRTQTSTVMVSEQMSLHSATTATTAASRDDVQSKTKGGGGALQRQQGVCIDGGGGGKEGPDVLLVNRGYVNGFGAEQSKKNLLMDNGKDETIGCGDADDGLRKGGGGFRTYEIDAHDEFDYRKCQQGKVEDDDDDEQDIIKEDLV